MAYLPHLRYVIGGNLGSNTPAPEEWSCTINVGNDTGSHHVIEAAMAEAAWDAWNTNIMPNPALGAAVSLEYAKVSAIDEDGHVVGTVFRHDEHNQAGGTANLGPFTSALCVTLLTGLRGPSRRGRFYIPACNVETQYTDGQVPATTVTDLLADAAQFLQALKAYDTGLDSIIVASSKGYNTEVSQVTMGHVVDTQRRRRRSLPENYTTPISI